MKVTAQNHDEVSALLTVTINKSDYKDKVEKQLHHYAKNAQVPGFRKGKVPMSMVRRQYEAPVALEEINKTVSDALNSYIQENGKKMVGQPVPQAMGDIDLQAEEISISFEVGYEPDMTIDLAKYEMPYYKVEASDKEVGKSVENMQKRFATQEAQEKITNDSHVVLKISQVVEKDAEGEHNHPPKHIVINKERKEAFALIKKLKKNESVKVTKSTLLDNEELAKQLEYSKEELENIHHDELEITVNEFYALKDHELNQELFDKVYGQGAITSEEELKNKVKEELDEYFQQNSDVYFVNKILEEITQKEEVQLPENFLLKWLVFNNENIQTEEQAKEILEKERSIIKHQIIEGKLMNDHDVKIDYADVLAQAQQLMRNQLAIYGIHHLGDEEIDKYAVEILKDPNQLQQISQEVAMAKLKDVILEKATKKEQKISHDEFLEIIKEK